MKAIEDWLTGNSCAQFLFIGTHGIFQDSQCIGLGANGTDFLDWNELTRLLSLAERPPVLWLGACKSSDVAKACSKINIRQIPASWIVGFTEKISPIEIEVVLQELVSMTSTSNIIFVSEELAKIKSKIKDVHIDYYYPIPDREGKIVYANEAQMHQMYSISIDQYLNNNR